ncbi:hypothetical protein AAIP79_004443 [Klebsiella aerogenes]
MADWFIATEGVKVVKDSTSLWPQIITAVSSIGAALGGVSLTHHFTRRREKKAAAGRLESERLFIATELVFILEQFAGGCARVAYDSGYPDVNKKRLFRVKTPCIDFSAISGDWRTLPGMLMYRIREISLLQDETELFLGNLSEPKGTLGIIGAAIFDIFDERQYRYTKLGLKASVHARRLRKLVNMPINQFDPQGWTPESALWRKWREKRADKVKQHREDIAEVARSLTMEKDRKENE